MKLPGVPYTPRYATNEAVTGIVVAIALHVAVIGPFIYKAVHPSARSEDDDKPLVSRPFVQASLLKLGKPIDPKKLPDRLIPQQRTAPKKHVHASQDDPGHKPDAGAPPPERAEDADLTNLVDKSDPFAEKNAKRRPEEGFENGSDAGAETDPNKVRAGDMYGLQLGQFFGQRLKLPTIISAAEERKLCAVYEVNVGRNMVIWYVKTTPVKSSGNALFDDAAREMLSKLLDDKTSLPTPPKEVDDQYRGRRLQIVVAGTHGDPSQCQSK